MVGVRVWQRTTGLTRYGLTGKGYYGSFANVDEKLTEVNVLYANFVLVSEVKAGTFMTVISTLKKRLLLKVNSRYLTLQPIFICVEILEIKH